MTDNLALDAAAQLSLGQWFRVTDEQEENGYFDESGDYHSSDYRSVRIVITPYEVESITPKGVWLYTGFLSGGGRKWVSTTSRKRFAYPTLEEAWLSFRARKAKQAQIYMAKFAAAKKAALLAAMPLDRALADLGFAVNDVFAGETGVRRSRSQSYSSKAAPAEKPMASFADGR